jgi:predicted negative regulator of RcsB-dependent stress response
MAAVAMLLATHPVDAARPDPEQLPATRVRDLHYGDVLFYVYQDDDFEAITRLNAYDHWNLLPHHEPEAQLLLGGLYLSLGLHNEAGARFEKLLTPDIPAGVRNRAWFYLAQVWYVRGYLDRAEHAIRQVQGTLPEALDAQREHLLANILLHQGRYDAAIELLNGWKGPADWTAYARFNLGVALVRSGKLAEADPVLTTVGTLASDKEELLALKDRANLALGFAYLQANQPGNALSALERVRLKGPSSNKALLGTGWAHAALGDYRNALTPWLELRDRNLLDSAVQESFLAVPYAFGKLAANAQAAQYYESALESFDSEGVRLDEAISRIRDGHMLDAILKKEAGTHYGWFWQLEKLPDAPESRYLYAVLAGHDFQEGLKNYRDLVYLGHTLEHWDESMQAFGDMLDTRERAYAERLPPADALLATGAADKLQRRREELEGRLDSVAAEADVAALGSPDERAQWAQIQRIEAALAAAPPGAETEQNRERLRLVKGVLFFRLDESFKARVWQQHRAIKDLDLALREAQNRWVRVERARKSAPTNTGEFAARIADLKARIDALSLRLVSTQARQNGYLGDLAVAQLQAQKDRLATYQIQARYELAAMYDRSQDADSPKKPNEAAPPGPVPPEPKPPAPPQP